MMSQSQVSEMHHLRQSGCFNESQGNSCRHQRTSYSGLVEQFVAGDASYPAEQPMDALHFHQTKHAAEETLVISQPARTIWLKP